MAFLLTWGFVVVAGSPVSGKRALLVFGAFAIARALGRKVLLLRLLLLLSAGLLAVEPSLMGTPAFGMSFGAVVGIVRIHQVLELPAWTRRPVVGFIPRSLLVTLGATLGTLPALSWWFQEFSWTGLFLNVIAIPWVGVLAMPTSVAAVWLPGCLGDGALQLALWSWNVLYGALSAVDLPTIAVAAGPWGVLSLCVCLGFPTSRFCWCVAFLVLNLRLSPSDHLQVTFFDVGQGDSTLVQWSDGRRWLIDGGPPGDRVLHALRRKGVRRLDVVVVSHGDLDHSGGLISVLERMQVGELWLSEEQDVLPLVELAKSRSIPIKIRPRQVLHPSQEEEPLSKNDGSLVLLVRDAGCRLLLPGDVSASVEQQLLKKGVPAVDILKVSHHGSKTSSSEAFVQHVKPKVALISAGRDNRFGHPHPSVMRRFSDRGLFVLQTAKQGTVELRCRDGQLSWRSFSEPGGWTELSRI